jgi:hypothetical protein
LGHLADRHLLNPPGSQTGALSCDISEYTRGNGPRAALEGSTLLVTWRGDADADPRLRLGLDDAQPIVREPAARPHGGEWGTLGRSVRPDFHVTSGKRRVSYQQLNPLRDLGVEITREVMEREKWYVFRDAPATGVEGRGYDQGVVEAEAVRTGEGHGVQVSLDVDGTNRAERRADIGEGVGNHRPLQAELAAQDGRELVEHLHADDATSQDDLPRGLALRVGSVRVDEHVGVDEGGHRVLASSRSKA